MKNYMRSLSLFLSILILTSLVNILPTVSASSIEEKQSTVAETNDDKETKEESEINSAEANLEFVTETTSEATTVEEVTGENDTNPTVSKMSDVVYSVETNTSGDFEYKVSDNQVTITKYTGTDKNLTIPSVIDDYSVTCIGNNAFANCIELTNIDIPKSVTSIGYYAFYNCDGLTSIFIPKTVTSSGKDVFGKCNNLKTVEFENGMSNIPDNIIENCTSLEKVIIPNSVTNIGSYAFMGCTNLSSIDLPDNLISIGNSTFYNCDELASIVIPKAVTTVGESAFGNCDNLKTVEFEDGMTKIPNNMMKNCTALEKAIIPSSVTSIGSYAFTNCKNLVAYTDKYSKVIVPLIDHNITVIPNNDIRVNDSEVLDTEKSNFSALSSKNISFTCNYVIKNEMFDCISNASIKIKIPVGTELVDKSVYLDKTLCTNFVEEDTFIQIPVTKKVGKINFSLRVASDCKMCTYAILNYKYKEKSDYEVIDLISENVDLISISTDEFTSLPKINVNGIAPINSDVDVYIDDKKVTTFKTNKVGNYNGEIDIPNVKNNQKYIVKVCSKDYKGNNISAFQEVNYKEDIPELTMFDMTYRGKTYDLLQNKRNYITFVLSKFGGGNLFEFSAKYKNADKIDSVLISSTRNQVTKFIRATYDSKLEMFIAKGYFDANDHDYVPGKIKIIYTLKSAKTNAMERMNHSLSLSIDDYSNEFKNAEISELTHTDNEYKLCVKFAGKEILVTQRTEMTESEVCEEFSSKLDESSVQNNKKNLISVGTSIGNKIIHTIGEDFCKDKFFDWVHDIYEEKLENCKVAIYQDESSYGYLQYDEQKKVFNSVMIDGLKNLDFRELLNFKEATSDPDLFSLLYSGKDPFFDYIEEKPTKDEIKRKILEDNNLTDKEKKQLIFYNEFYKVEKGSRGILNGLSELGYSMGKFYEDLWDNIMGFVKGALDGMFKLFDKYSNTGNNSNSNNEFLVDPSGYVYAGVTGNRISGATCTAYWIPYDENKEYWKKPDETKAILWDSSEYSQENPIITDAEGNYAWDVPEGWWKVVVEKAGYETYTTEWMPVPPPQLDVNINLKSTEKPLLENSVLSETGITLTFSQYMNPDSLRQTVVKDNKGNVIDYTLVYSKDDTDINGNIFAKEYKFQFDKNNSHTYSVNLTGVKNYCDIELNQKTIILTDDIEGFNCDLNGDGTTDIADVSYLQKHIIKLVVLEDYKLAMADVNSDGKIDIRDVACIQKNLLV